MQPKTSPEFGSTWNEMFYYSCSVFRAQTYGDRLAPARAVEVLQAINAQVREVLTGLTAPNTHTEFLMTVGAVEAMYLGCLTLKLRLEGEKGHF